MAEEKATIKAPIKKKGGWFQKIPADVLFSPTGLIAIFIWGLTELLDWIPLPIADQIWEIPLEIIGITYSVIVLGISLKGLAIPFILERIPVFNDIFPTFVVWFLRMFF